MPTPSSDREVTDLLLAWNKGEQTALENVIGFVHHELQSLAQVYLSRKRSGQDLEATTLINEVLLRLIDKSPIEWRSRRHFFAIAAWIMRHILIDHARKEITRTGR